MLFRLIKELALRNNYNISVFSDPIFFKNTNFCKSVKLHPISKSIQLNNTRGLVALLKIFLNFLYTLILVIKNYHSKKT